jgi:hypothetical protein
MLVRDVPLRALSLVGVIEPDDCRRIFASLANNAHLEGLAVGATRINADTVCLASQSAPALRSLNIRGRVTPGGAASLVQQLRTNITLVHLGLTGPSEPPREFTDGIKVALRQYNSTLRNFRAVGLARHRSIPRCLRRNERICQALEQLPKYRVAPAARLPRVLQMVNTLATLLYRFLRKGSIDALVDHLPQVDFNEKGGRAKKRIRKAD